MANLVELLQGQMGDQLLNQLTNQLGTKNKKQTSNATNAIFSVLTNALANNVQQKNGANSLVSALDKDHDGSVLDDLAGLLGGADTRMNRRATNGVGILGHLLGNRQNSVIDMISQMSGLNQNKTASLMVKLAPMILGMLGKQKRSNNMNQNDLSDFLRNSAQQENKRHGQSDFLTKMLDRDGDGSIMDEVAGMGMKALGSFFRR